MDEVKTRLKMALKSLIKIKVIIILLVFVIIFTLILPSFVYFLTIDDGTYKEGDWSSTPYGASTFTGEATITGDGITTETTAEELWNEMIHAGSRVDEYLSSYEELEKLMNAELVTQYPKIQGATGLNGIIEFERHDRAGNISTLQYIDEATFNSYITNGNSAALNYFTLDEEKNAVVAKWSQTDYTFSTNDEEVSTTNYTDVVFTNSTTNSDTTTSTAMTYVLTKEAINYKSMVQSYTMPFDYLWALMVISEDKEFVMSLADLVYNSQIKIGIFDNVTTTTDETVYTYKKENMTETYARLFIANTFGVSGYSSTRYWVSPDNSNYNSKYPADYSIDNKDYNVTNTIKIQVDSLTIKVTLADTWIAKYTQDFANSIPADAVTVNTANLDDTEYKQKAGSPVNSNSDSSLLNNSHAVSLRNETKTYIENNRVVEPTNTIDGTIIDPPAVVVEVSYVECWYSNHEIEKTQTNTMTVNAQTYISSPATVQEKTDRTSTEANFVTLLTNSSRAKNNIFSVPDWLFEILETNSTTANMVDLTKYLLNKTLNSNKFGDIDLDFDSIYAPGSGNMVSICGDDFDVSDESLFITDRDELLTAFKDGYSASEKLVANVDAFLTMQSTYKVNAIFAASVSITETGAGRTGHAVDGHNNWFNVRGSGSGGWATYRNVQEAINAFASNIANGSYYYTQGRHTVATIGPVYCPNTDEWPHQANDWVTNTLTYISNFYNAAGIQISTNNISETAVTGDGYSKEISLNGRTYKEYKQTQGSYSTTIFGNTNCSAHGYPHVHNNGCGPTSTAIIASGYGKNYSPGDIATLMGGRGASSSGGSIELALTTIGISAHDVYNVTKEGLRAQLQTGRPLIVSVDSSLNGKFTNGGHLMAVLGIDSSDNVYISNPNPSTATGWISLNDLYTCCKNKYYICIDTD